MQTPPCHPTAGDTCQLQLEGVSKFRADRAVVDGVSLDVRQGQVVGIVGPNGAGKSTTFNILVGRERPNQGRVLLSGLDITHLPLQQRSRLGIGYMPQESSIFKGLSVRDNLLLIMQETGVAKYQQEQRMQDLLTDCCLKHVENIPGRFLSGGERRRTELARVLASNAAGGPPKILLLDEPFAGVDPIGVNEMQRQFRRLCSAKGMGILITDHKVMETLNICNRAYMMHKGRIMVSGEPEVIRENKYVREYYLGENLDRSRSGQLGQADY